MPCAPCTDSVQSREGGEDKQGDDLEHDTRNHEIRSYVAETGVVACAGCDASTGSLHHERDEIAGDEDPSVIAGFEDRALFAEGEDDVFEGEVDGCCDEGWGED